MGESSDTVFDLELGKFRRWQASPWGRLRYTTAAANLAAHLPPGPLEVLDVGGGSGLDAIELAVRGHCVTIADISEPSLAEARVLADGRGVGDRISTRLVGVESVAREFGGADFDVVLCHNLIQYVADPGRVIAELAAPLSATGLVSVIAPNADADPLLTAVRSLDLDEALRLLDAPIRFTATYSTETRACYADRVALDLAAAGLRVVAHCGIRSVCDLIVDDNRKTDPVFFAQLERLELALATRTPYIYTARFFQLIATRTDIGDDVTSGK
ncbi:methyltransferase domain-containing protein [Nocardia sp. NPDC050793]|uniref:class I SAM-dependent methyltransferase n=1 Tax=Nocardia sp. NPDC050793 TaxID=3155159 RepID=UPI0033E2F04C